MQTNENTTTSEEERRIAILDALTQTILSKRTEAISGRAACGIENDWIGDEEFYQGYDDANRDEFVSGPSKSDLNGRPREKAKGSTVFPNITQPYVDAAAARVGDMLLPTDDRNFALEAGKIPEMLPEDDPEIQPRMITMPDGSQMTIAEVNRHLSAVKAEASRKAEKAQTRIDDWMTECQAMAEIRKVIEDSARLGSGVIKGPVAVRHRVLSWRTDEGTGERTLAVMEEIRPASFRIDPWNFFPDPACGESIHNGGFTFERDYLTPKKLADLKGMPGYLDSQIDICLDEGPMEHGSEVKGPSNSRNTKGQFEIWYFHGEIKTEELEAAGCDCSQDKNRKKSYPAVLTLVGDRMIRASINMLDSGEFPYDVIPWKRRTNLPWGMGIARQMRTPQRIVVAATRNMMDNAGLGGGPQFVVRRGIEPKDGKWEIVPRKIWVEGADSDGQTGAPFLSVVIPMLQAELQNIVQMGMKMAEDVTGLPMMMQGQQGKAPDTVGGMTILNNNANSVLRRIARLFDSCITEPHIRRYYAWLMQYGDDDDEKGDFNIVARGSTALVERDIQNQEMINILQLCLNPVFEKNPARAMDEYLKSRRFDPAAFDYTDDEKKKRAQQPPQPPLPLAVAQVRAQADLQKTQMQLQSEQQIAQLENQTQRHRIEVDTDRDTALVNAQSEQNQNEHAARMEELRLKRELAMLDYANKRNLTLDEIKADLAKEASRQNLQRELAGATHAIDLHKHATPQVATPPIEPPGRAPAGEAFQR